MTRREIRTEIFKILFAVEFYTEEEMEEQIAFAIENDKLSEDDVKYIREKCKDTIAHLDEIDAMIDEVSENWKTNRMAKVDLTLIRLAVYEMKFEELASGIAINEAVEIAKRFGSDNSSAFVNGVLGKIK